MPMIAAYAPWSRRRQRRRPRAPWHRALWNASPTTWWPTTPASPRCSSAPSSGARRCSTGRASCAMWSARRSIPWPTWWGGGDVQALQQFIGQSPWDAESVLHAPQAYVGETLGDAEEGAFLIDGGDFPTQGTKSVGVAGP